MLEVPLEDSAEDLYEHAPCGYLSLRPDGTIARVNETLLRWLGHTRESLVGERRFADLLAGGGRIYHETHFAPLLEMQGAVREISFELACADGRRLPVLVNAVARRDGAGRTTSVRIAVFDARDRQAYERELIDARHRERIARERTERLQGLTAALAGPLAPEEIAAAGVGHLMEGDDVAGAAVAIREGEPPEVRLLAARGRPIDSGALGRFESSAAEGIAVVPLSADGSLAGVLAVVLDPPREPTEEERTFLTACAWQCAVALEREQLRARADREARRMALVAELTRALGEVPTVAERVDRLVDVLVPALADAAEVRPEGAALAPPGGVALPLRAEGRVTGTLLLDRGPSGRRFDADALAFARDVADRAALLLENARRYEQEREIAHALQQSLLSGELTPDPRYEIATRYLPGVEAIEASGDWHQAFAISGERLGVAVGDVVGRGIHAAAAMGQLRSAVRALGGAGLGPAGVLDRLDTFVAGVPSACYATLAYAEVDLAGARMRFACAGHPPPVLLPAAGEPRLLWDGRSAPLGAITGSARGEAECALGPGDRLLLYTDGLVERRHRALDEQLDRLVATLGRLRDLPLEELVEALSVEMLRDARSRDDVCLLCFSRAAQPNAGTTASP